MNYDKYIKIVYWYMHGNTFIMHYGTIIVFINAYKLKSFYKHLTTLIPKESRSFRCQDI